MHNIDENQVLRNALSGLNEDVPPMPEDLHASWMQKLEEDMEENKLQKTRDRKALTRFLSIAAAMVFVVGGTLLTRDELHMSEQREQITHSKSATYGAALANDAYYYDEAVEEEASMDTGVMLTSMSRGADTSTRTLRISEKKIIRTASLTIATQTFDASLSTLRSSCEAQGGWVESSSESLNSSTGLRTAYLTLRVPQSELDSYLADTSDLGRITRRSETATDVTASYQDTQARLNTQLALMDRLQALITESADLSDLLALESQIADTQYAIDTLQSSLNTTDRQVTYSTVDITLKEETTPDLTDTTVSLGDRIKAGIQLGWETLTDFLADMLVFIVAALPFIGIVAAFAIVMKIINRIRRRNK